MASITQQNYWFSVDGLVKFQHRYNDLLIKKKQLFNEISLKIQMDQHTEELTNMVKEYSELNTVIEQIEQMKPSIELVNVSFLHNENPSTVEIGTKVTIQYNGQEIVTYTITPYGETDLTKHHISYTSELGAQLMKKKVGDQFNFEHHQLVEHIQVLDIQS